MFRFPISPLLAVAGFLALASTAPAVPALPTINTAHVVNITSFGAVSSTTLTNTTAIQNAINSAATTNGGCTVEIPAGTYLSGPLTLKSGVNLQIDSGAMLQMLPYAKWPGTTTFIDGTSLHDVEISGSGTIDGQGADWWTAYNASKISRPNFINFSGCTRILIQNVTLQNPPTFHLMLKGNNVDLTVQGITINTPGTSPNTDGMDLGSTNVLIQNCSISDGDDNIEIGGSSALAANIVITNCAFGTGHGVSIGSLVQAGVSNLTVINCTFDGTDNGIRIKSQRDRGGMVQNLNYFNLTMTNVDWPFLIYSYYEFGLGTITPANSAYAANVAATDTVTSVTATTPIYRNITFSNITAYGNNSRPALMIWGLPQMAVSNVVFKNVTLSSTRLVEIFNARGIKFIDSPLNFPAATNGFDLYNAEIIVSNSTPTSTLSLINGISTNGYGNSLAFYNARAALSNTNAFDDGPLTLADSLLVISNNLTLIPTTVLNFVLDSNTNRVAVVGNLGLGGTVNVTTNSSGFAPGTNILLTYTTNLTGSLPTLGAAPAGYSYAFDTSVAKQVRLVITATNNASPTATTNTLQSSANPSTYGSSVTFTATVSPAPTNGETVTFKDGSVTLGTGALSGGQATYTTSASQLAATTHSITAVYGGDGAYGASTSSALSQTVNPRGLTVSGLTVNSKVYDGTTGATLNTNGSTLNPVVGGDVVTVVTNGSTATFASANAANGVSVTVTNLSLGGAPATNYTLGQPAGLTANITPAGSSVGLSASANPVAHLSGVTFTASLTPSSVDGTVLFLTNGVAFNSQTLSGGTATSAATAALPRGTITISARYSGNANYLPSTNTLSEVVTNNPPVAKAAVNYRLVGSPLTIPLTSLATNWSDLDGDVLGLAGVSTPSTNGGTVTYDSNNIYYNDSNNVTDRFGYTVSDGQGGTANGIITVLLAQQNISGVTVGGGGVVLNFRGIPGSLYWVEAATNLSPANWQPISTNVADLNGLWQFTDTQATNLLQRFYRSQSGQ